MAKQVVVVSDSARPYQSGVGVVIDGINEMIGREFHITLVAPYHPGEECYKGIEVIRLPSWPLGRGYRSVTGCTESSKTLLLNTLWKADVIHLHTVSPLTWYVMRLAREYEVPAPKVLHLHTQYDAYAKAMFWGMPLAGRLASGFVSAVAKDADIVVCPSAHYRDVVMRRMGLTCKAEVWEAPVDLPTPCAPDEFPAIDGLFDPEYEYLLYSGRMVEEKNLEFLFEVFHHLAKKNPFVKLVLAGGGKVEKYKNVCRKICGASSKRVIFTGHLKRDQLAYLIGGTSMGVTSSFTEAQGLAVLEQLGLGTPIAVMEGTYLAEVVTTSGSGLALPPDPKVWAQSISRALTDEMWRFEAGNNGRLYIEMCFNRMVRREALLELYATGAG